MSSQKEYTDGYYRLKSPTHSKVMKACPGYEKYKVRFEDESETFDQVWYVTFDDKSGVVFKSCYGRYLCSEGNPPRRYSVIADRENPKDWEHWVMEKVCGDAFALKSWKGMYLTVNEKGEPNSDKESITSWEEFTLEKVNI